MSVVCGEGELKEWEMGGRGVCMRFEGGGDCWNTEHTGEGGEGGERGNRAAKLGPAELVEGKVNVRQCAGD